jgi:ferrochelatase
MNGNRRKESMPSTIVSSATQAASAVNGVLLVNLGTPDAPTPAALRRYLAEFLADPRVVEAPRWLWRLVLHGIILRIRPRRSAHAYRQIWTEQGSPLLFNTQRLLQRVQTEVNSTGNSKTLFALGMRYGNPSIAAALAELRAAGVRRLLVLPLYPQYSGSTTGSTFDAVSGVLQDWRRVPALRFVDDYHDSPSYINAMAEQLRRYWQAHGKPQKLLLSFHGIPQRYVSKGDPYAQQCERTAKLLAEALQLKADAWQLVYQSRFGAEPWLQPYADKTLSALPAAGIKHVAVFCPGFAVDCLETLEEMAMGNKNRFLQAGGERFDYVPALNDSPEHARALADLIKHELSG